MALYILDHIIVWNYIYFLYKEFNFKITHIAKSQYSPSENFPVLLYFYRICQANPLLHYIYIIYMSINNLLFNFYNDIK
jgi:hypothetical protein